VKVATDVLLADPVFQLNVVLWTVQPLPPTAPIEPVLRRAGYELHAVGPPLPAAPSARPALLMLVGSADAPKPDVVLAHHTDPSFLVVECKAQGFGSGGAGERQVVKLLAAAHSLNGPLGLPVNPDRPGYVAYLTVAPEHSMLLVTLLGAQERLREEGVAPGGAGTLGLHAEDDGVWVDAGQVDEWPPPAAAALANRVRIVSFSSPGEDPRPFYLIPWVPDVAGGQDPQLAAFGKAVLGANVLNAAKSAVGRADVPGPVVMRMDRLLHDATLGVTDFWRDRDDYRLLLRACQDFVARPLRGIESRITLVVSSGPELVQFTLPSETVRDEVLALLHGASPAAFEPSGTATLFDVQ